MDITIKEEPRFNEIIEVSIHSGITPDDVDTLLDMAASSGLFASDLMMSTEDMAWDSAYSDGNEPHIFLKATYSTTGENRTAGFICFGPIDRWDGYYELYGIAVDPACQRLGIGSALLSEMIRQITVAGGKGIFLETGGGRSFENARLFYEANGFTQETRFHKQFIPSAGDVVYRFDIDTDGKEEQQQ
ncbi:GCN5-related N-acetyltransferase [Pseudodesulfovibrio profundus]|uniref:GCN5-related N-acetyltransferase n=1 Tax=Pseudodesulfovibrio profundus TaxID=57320 RepID=A0A2C8FEF4_9BACT|nr:N-acetyltransferase [Pseudodesulfovibrio profundus]MBC16980.1 GNAT family N-acetyltransferase [Desulfovibrio sp.]SOB60439.1 GCN5-related N-acetyltransferase [Pseudodesulfovibrio profundus]|tara:strand:- start:117 stop:680 length:564 start_codon:yes stop_codon:yes gene_type:complete